MAYIGTPVQQALTKVTSQSFNGTGSQTVFTLNRAVNTGEELEVFVNNVQQEPGVGKSYTATGTTLTFDAAPSSGTGNVYVIYRGLAEVTRRLEHDPNAALAATTGTFSGNLLVGTTSYNSTLAGHGLGANGFVYHTRDNAVVTHLNRKTSDGDIVEFRKDGTTVGSIASRASVVSSIILDPRSGGGGLTGGGAALYPTDNAGAPSDGVLTLGDATARFYNLYLSGGAYLGGTGSANYLEDYEEGTWTPTLGGSATAGSFTYSNQSGYYVKVGNQVTITFSVTLSAIGTAGTGFLRIIGSPWTTSGSAAAQYARGSLTLANVNFNGAANSMVLAPRSSSGTEFVIYEVFDGANIQDVGAADLTATSFITGQITLLLIS